MLWARQAGNFHYDQGLGIATDLQSNCYITGLFRSVAAFGPHVLVNNGDPDIFVAKYDANGTALWAKQAGGTLVDNGYALAIDDSSNCYVTGRFTSPAPLFDNLSLQNSNPAFNPNDFFVARLGADTLTGMTAPDLNQSFIIYPNPLVTESALLVHGHSGESVYELFDVRGSLLRRVSFTGGSTTISRESLAPGIYMLRVIMKTETDELLLIMGD